MNPPEDMNQFQKNRDTVDISPPFRQVILGEDDVKTLGIYFYQDIGVGAAERKGVDDHGQELYFCAYYNRRVPEKYEFISEYRFYIAKQPMCHDVYWNLGYPPDESVILEQFNGETAAEASPYGEIFADLKSRIVNLLRELKENTFDPFEIGGSLFSYTPGQGISIAYTVCEMPDIDKREFVQFYFTGEKLKSLSRSPVPLEDMMRFFPDFDTLDKNQLHLRTFLPPVENAVREGSQYHEMYLEALDSIDFDRTVHF